MRWLTCQTCREQVGVFEEPHEFIDEFLFTCGRCLRPVEGQLELDEPRTEVRDYDPTIAAIPY